MKKKFTPFLSGMLTMALVGGLAVSALAASGAMTITVDPVNIQVNGQTFAPKDATGADVPVFAYNGTTYAPLRALAEAYGLEVGYDAGTNMATVTGDITAPEGTTSPAPDTLATTDYSDWTAEEEAAYQEFKGMWEVGEIYSAKTVCLYNGDLSKDQLISIFDEHDYKYWYPYLMRFAKEMGVPISFNYGEYPLFMAKSDSVVFDSVFGIGAQSDGVPIVN